MLLKKRDVLVNYMMVCVIFEVICVVFEMICLDFDIYKKEIGVKNVSCLCFCWVFREFNFVWVEFFFWFIGND